MEDGWFRVSCVYSDGGEDAVILTGDFCYEWMKWPEDAPHPPEIGRWARTKAGEIVEVGY